jgi:hypothetical protein
MGGKEFTARKIEGHDLVLRDAVKIAVATDAQTARLTKLGQPIGREDAHKRPVGGVVFADGRHGTGRAE